jgi:hypothetical protein
MGKQLAPSVRRASFPVSFWASETLKQRQLGCQVELSRLRTSWRYLAGMAMVSLLVSMMSPNMVCFGLITSSNHLSMARGHCLTVTSGLPITMKMVSIIAARTILYDQRQGPTLMRGDIYAGRKINLIPGIIHNTMIDGTRECGSKVWRKDQSLPTSTYQ